MDTQNTPSRSDSDTGGRIGVGIVALVATAYSLLWLRNWLLTDFDVFLTFFGSAVSTVAILCWWFALRGHIPESRARMRLVTVGAGIGGGIGFALGFFGPLLLDLIMGTDSPQGPLLGIFITGPLGFVVGAAVGYVYGLFRTRRPSPG